MRWLVLGGTHFVGRAAVETLLATGDEVTTLTSGRSGPPAAGARARYADRRDRAAVAAALAGGTWDAVLDTWSGAPVAVRDAVGVLRGRVGTWCQVSSRSVYRWPPPPGADESAAVVDGDPGASEPVDYAADKRGGELAALEHEGPVLVARAGLVLGPYEDVGRLPFWLGRVARGGRVPVPGPPERPLQLIDARDLAGWLRTAAVAGTSGVFNAASRPGHTTMGGLLDACVRVTDADAEPVWVSPEAVAAAGVEPWTGLPIWTPPTGELAALHDCSTEAAHAAGLVCRPAGETVRDTWAWMRGEGAPAGDPRRVRPMDAADEARLLAAAG